MQKEVAKLSTAYIRRISRLRDTRHIGFRACYTTIQFNWLILYLFLAVPECDVDPPSAMTGMISHWDGDSKSFAR